VNVLGMAEYYDLLGLVGLSEQVSNARIAVSSQMEFIFSSRSL
jgi:hypothetical protein